MTKCEACDGTGDHIQDPIMGNFCPACGGDGVAKPSPAFVDPDDCPGCNGVGTVSVFGEQRCGWCSGTGSRRNPDEDWQIPTKGG